MHRAIGLAAQHRQLQFLQEQALAADRGQRAVQHFVAAGAHRHQHDLQPGMVLAQRGGDVFALPKGERALAGGDAERGHPAIIPDRARNAYLERKRAPRGTRAADGQRISSHPA
ncbi:hypothetical protein XHV734_0837 [Xanthomonas hortorum pv. vitians]|nr:hypothetical protein XHV734_0837 [Xanthomonas hortorum pv. vitians]